MSPSETAAEERSLQYMLVKQKGLCGELGQELSKDTPNAGDCAALARAAEASSFALGVGFKQGACLATSTVVDKAKMDAWIADRRAPACDAAGGWVDNEMYDF